MTITGAGGSAESATDFSPDVQAAREVITGSAGDDTIHGDGAAGMGSGWARNLDIAIGGEGTVTVKSVLITGLPPAFEIVGATQAAGGWQVTLPTDPAAAAHLTVMIRYAVIEDGVAYTPETFELKITASGTLDDTEVDRKSTRLNSSH